MFESNNRTMTLLFWILWIIDLIAALFLIWAVGFRGSFGASTDRQVILLVLLVVVVIGAPFLRFMPRWKTASLVLSALPVAAGLVVYIIDVMQNPEQ